MQPIDQKRITLLSLIGASGGDTLQEKYKEASALMPTLEEDGWFGGKGKSSGQNKPSSKQESPTKSSKSDSRPASSRDVQRVLDLDDTHDTEKLEAMTRSEIKALIAELQE